MRTFNGSKFSLNKLASFIFMLSCSLILFSISNCYATPPIKIAAIFAKTGDAQMISVFSFRGAALGVEEINKNGGLLGKKVKLIEIDNKSSSIGSRLAALKAVKLKVIGVIGANWSTHSLAMAPVLQKAAIPMISSKSTNPVVTRIGNYIFRVCYTDAFQGRAMASFAINHLKAKTAVALLNVNSDFSMGLVDLFVKSFTKKGGVILWTEDYFDKTTNFSSILKRIEASYPDVVFVPGYQKDSSLLFRQALKMNIEPVFLGADPWDGTMLELAGNAANGSYFTDHWNENLPSRASRAAVQKFKTRFPKSKVNATELLAYDAVMLFADAVKRAGSLRRNKIRQALSVTENFHGATGDITMDKNGDPKNKKIVILKFENNKIRFVKAVKP